MADNPEAQIPLWFVSHAWLEPIHLFLTCLRRHSTLRELRVPAYWGMCLREQPACLGGSNFQQPAQNFILQSNEAMPWGVAGSGHTGDTIYTADTFTLLGIQYNLSRPSSCVDADIVSDNIQRRCLKIRLAAQHLGTRIALVHKLVISLFAWSGAFHHFSARTIRTWTSMIETALWGRRAPPGRSRLLFWNSLGSARLHPMFALQFTAARAEWNRQCRRAQGLPAATSPAPPLESSTQRLEMAT